MKKAIATLLIILLLVTLVVFPIGCEWFENVINSIFGKTPAPDNGNTAPPVTDDEEFEDYGMNVITVELDNANVTEKGKYNTKEEVGAYIYLYHKLPDNYTTDKYGLNKYYTPENKLSYTGGNFYNREGLLPSENGRTFTECDIGYRGGNRGSQRIVFSSDWLVFYTDNHYESFSIMRFV